MEELNGVKCMLQQKEETNKIKLNRT